MPGFLTSKAFIISALIALNAIPALGAEFLGWNWEYVWYGYWAECALLGLMAFIVYIKHLLIFVLILGIAALLFGLSGHTYWSDIRIPVAFWSVYSLCWLAYFELGNSHFGLKMRRKHPLAQFGFYLLFMACSMTISFCLTAALFHGWSFVLHLPREIYVMFLVLSAVVPTIAIGILKIVHIIGEHHFFHFLLGTYHRPVEIGRVVLFMDMVGSSRIAEKLSPKDSMRLISQFIFDAGAIIRRHGGDIINYTGDGLVVLWPVTKADKALNAVYAMRSQFERTRHLYERDFGVRPYFRMGLHAGNVVISQIGEEKLFLGLYGDVVNTASRLEEMNKVLDTKVLVSRDVLQWLSPGWVSRLDSMGVQTIRGRDERIEVFTLPIRNPSVKAIAAE